MKKVLIILIAIIFQSCSSDTKDTNVERVSSQYTISFNNAVHHEAEIHASFTNLKSDEIEFRMSRTSPGRYALHEFMKNIYSVKVSDGDGNVLVAERPDPYSWKVKGHNGTINVTYTLFANRGGGTYAQIDETHAHLNIPATFIYAPTLENDAIEVTFNVREDLKWKIATQLKHIEGNTYYARDLQYFMDSPTEISDFGLRSFDVKGQTVNLVLHHNGTDTELDEYFEKVKKVVLQQEAVYGELPKFDYNNYYFLTCYIPNASGDGMEHRNSTILTSTRSLADGGMNRNIGTVSHEFFHAWNVERIRPKSLEPFDFQNADMSGALWFAEGFTSYYTGLILERVGLRSEEEYINGLASGFSSVWNSPGRNYFNPIEMSYQAPFVDAATAVDPNNRNNTFISYYTYGSVLGLALDLSLREINLNLDDYMKLVWEKFGKPENPYHIEDLQKALNEYAGNNFGDIFFGKYIYKSEMPEMKRLFELVGVSLKQEFNKAYFGVNVNNQEITSNPKIDSPAYNSHLEQDDKILFFGGIAITDDTDFSSALANFSPGDNIEVVFERFNELKTISVTLDADPAYTISMFEQDDKQPSEAQLAARKKWLDSKVN